MAANADAAGLGLRPGMKLAQAQALVPGLAMHDADPAGDAAVLRQLAEWCLRYAPLAGVDPPDGLWIDVTGSTHLHGGETRLLRDLLGRLRAQGWTACAAVADIPAVAHAVARYGPGGVVPNGPGGVMPNGPGGVMPNGPGGVVPNGPGGVVPNGPGGVVPNGPGGVVPNGPGGVVPDGPGGVVPNGPGGVVPNGPGGVVPAGSDVMAGFPIEALRLPAEMLADLRLMGFERVGPLATAARAPLVRRFGVALAKRLDQATGVLFEPIAPVTPPASIQARLTFVEPLLTAEAFSSVIARLVTRLCNDLDHAGQGVRRLDLRFERVDGSVQAIRVGTARPVRDARHLGRMLDERLERIDPGLGVEAMHLIAAAVDKLGFVQTASSLVAEASPDLAPLVDRLANRLGDNLVYRLVPVESDVPERSVRLAPALARLTGGWPADLPRPVRLLDPPQPIDAMALLPDHPPVAFTWRHVRHRVRHADGPERITGEWWKRDREWLSVRDYFRVEDEDGRRFWLFRRGNGSDPGTGDMSWFLHGFF